MLPNIAYAYVGPGAGLGAIGTVIALLGAVVLGIVGFVWYPLKKLLAGKKEKPKSANHSEGISNEDKAKPPEAATSVAPTTSSDLSE